MRDIDQKSIITWVIDEMSRIICDQILTSVHLTSGLEGTLHYPSTLTLSRERISQSRPRRPYKKVRV